MESQIRRVHTTEYVLNTCPLKVKAETNTFNYFLFTISNIMKSNQVEVVKSIINNQEHKDENTEIIEVVKPITNGRLSALNRLPLEAYSNESENNR